MCGVIGLFTPRRGAARCGSRVPAEMYVLAVHLDALYGAFQSYAQAFYTEIIPSGAEVG